MSAPAGKTPSELRDDSAPDHLVLSEHSVFRRFWYVAGFCASITTKPVARTVLGTDLVLWRPTPDALVCVAVDRCAHRDAPLSRGWVANCRLVCAYHGWEWDEQGRTQRIPQFPDAPYPGKSALTMVASQERYGMVWICLADDAQGGALGDIPALPEYDDPEWRVVPEYEWPFACTAMHLLENNVDPGHVAFVHRNSFGNAAEPELTDSTVTRTSSGLMITGENRVESRPGEIGSTVRRTATRMHLPFYADIRISYPDGLQHLMIKAITPVDDDHCLLTQTVLRSDSEADRPAADILAFDNKVEAEDRDLLELLPTPFPLARHLNAHAKGDRNSLAVRRLWADLIAGSRPA